MTVAAPQVGLIGLDCALFDWTSVSAWPVRIFQSALAGVSASKVCS